MNLVIELDAETKGTMILLRCKYLTIEYVCYCI